uniref:Uncharacterized protein n=1 Tax=Ascaris lumbricoides TaxID=6252 RepID=A0A9J2Q9H4_ASCLU
MKMESVGERGPSSSSQTAVMEKRKKTDHSDEMHLCGSRFINSADEESVSDYEGDSRLSVEDCERHESHRQTSQQSGGTVMGDAEEVYRRTFVPRLIEEDSVDQFESIVETLQQYKAEIIEESGIIFEKTLTFIITIFLGYITNLCSFSRRTTTSIFQDFRNAFALKPISEKLNYSSLAVYVVEIVTLSLEYKNNGFFFSKFY